MNHTSHPLTWQMLSEETIIKDSWIDLRASKCRLPNGIEIEPFYVNYMPDSVAVVAVTVDHHVILVRQYRHGTRKVLLEIPAGGVEKGEDPVAAVVRELEEETGCKAGSIEFLCKIAPNSSNCSSYAHCYLARNVVRVGEQHLDETESLEVVEMEAEQVKELLRQGGFEQSVHVAALYSAMDRGAL
ncbi:MAG: NUDIX hydrolase [Enterocloster asparagiformis]|nr:NUDIX hydrolase [Enterocloster asparagiformis]